MDYILEADDRGRNSAAAKALVAAGADVRFVRLEVADYRVGPVKAERLLDRFGSVRGVPDASEDELRQVQGVGA